MKIKKRLDVLLVEQGYAETRTKAQAIIMSGLVYVDGQKADKPGTSYEESLPIEVRTGSCPYVSRGGLKLEKALRDFGVDPTGYVCSDSGASTGGFTDCLLKRGAKRVYAIDAGVGQLHPSLLEDSRVCSIEKFNARELNPDVTEGMCDVAVADVSFISQTYIIPPIAAVLRDGGGFVSLIKPQFEAGSSALGKGGIVTSSAYRFLAVKRVLSCAIENGFDCKGLIPSPITGGDGNKEYLAYFEKSGVITPKIDDKYIKRITAL